jgi:protein involved in polysaccharide export with SLBB domain
MVMGSRATTALRFVLASVLLPGCFSVENPTRVDSPEFQAALPAGKYLIQPGDELDIRFFHTPNLNVTLPVRPDGYISLPYVGDVQASGKDAKELSEELMAQFKTELRNPEITVIVRTFSGYRVHVGGNVGKPGVFPLQGTTTVLDSIFAAGGAKRGAMMSQVVVIRRIPRGSYQVIPLDLEAVLEGKDFRQNIQLLPYDAVYVPNSPVADVNEWVDLYIRQNLPIDFGFVLRSGPLW